VKAAGADHRVPLFSMKEVANIDIGLRRDRRGAARRPRVRRERKLRLLANDAAVTSALHRDGYGFGAANEPASWQFFITSGGTKAFGAVNPTSTSLDGYVAFSSA
jgi:hypothetical protein